MVAPAARRLRRREASLRPTGCCFTVPPTCATGSSCGCCSRTRAVYIRRSPTTSRPTAGTSCCCTDTRRRPDGSSRGYYNRWFTGSLDGGRFRPVAEGLLDGGYLHALRTFADERGRRLLLGMIREGRPREAGLAAGWVQAMSLPQGGVGPRRRSRGARSRARASRSLRREHARLEGIEVAGTRLLDGVRRNGAGDRSLRLTAGRRLVGADRARRRGSQRAHPDRARRRCRPPAAAERRDAPTRAGCRGLRRGAAVHRPLPVACGCTRSSITRSSKCSSTTAVPRSRGGPTRRIRVTTGSDCSRPAERVTADRIDIWQLASI